MKRSRFPSGWDEAAFRRRDQTVMVVPKRLVPAISRLIERQGARREPG